MSKPAPAVQSPLANPSAHFKIPRSTTALVQQTALIRRKQVEALTALSRSRIYDLMKQGAFPRPVSLGAMSVAWLDVEIHEWIANRIADRKTA